MIAGDDHLIDKNEFKDGLKINNTLISDRLFDLFDTDSSGFIDLNEFTETMESLINGNKESKIKFAFELHDLDNNGFIDKSELKILIEESFDENNLDFDYYQIEILIEEFFSIADTDSNGRIDYIEFLDAANTYPDFIDGITVNPIFWLISDRYEEKVKSKKEKPKSKSVKISNIQVQDIGSIKSLLIPRIISFYNLILNRKKTKIDCLVSGFKLLPSEVMEIKIKFKEKFQFNAGDYIYLNTSKVSRVEWHPFNVIERLSEEEVVLQVKMNNRWTKKLCKKMLETFKIKKEFNQKFDWRFKVDGPYGTQSRNPFNSEHLIMVGAGHGISKFAPILKDIKQKIKSGGHNFKKIDLYWLILDKTYFSWFIKFLNDFKKNDLKSIFRYHIYFLEKKPDQLNDKLLFVSKDILNDKTNVNLIEDLWTNSSFGYPRWSKELKNNRIINKGYNSNLLYSGPDNFIDDIKGVCSDLDIKFNNKNF